MAALRRLSDDQGFSHVFSGQLMMAFIFRDPGKVQADPDQGIAIQACADRQTFLEQRLGGPGVELPPCVYPELKKRAGNARGKGGV